MTYICTFRIVSLVQLNNYSCHFFVNKSNRHDVIAQIYQLNKTSSTPLCHSPKSFLSHLHISDWAKGEFLHTYWTSVKGKSLSLNKLHIHLNSFVSFKLSSAKVQPHAGRAILLGLFSFQCLCHKPATKDPCSEASPLILIGEDVAWLDKNTSIRDMFKK